MTYDKSKTAQSLSSFDDYVENNLTVSLAFENTPPVEEIKCDLVNITQEIANKAVGMISRPFSYEVKLEPGLSRLKKKTKNKKTTIKKELEEWSCKIKIKTEQLKKYNLRSMRKCCISNLDSFIEQDPKILKSEVLITRLSNEEILSAIQNKFLKNKELSQFEDPGNLDLLDLNIFNFEIPAINDDYQFTDGFFNEFEILDPNLASQIDLNFTSNLQAFSARDNFVEACTQTSFNDIECKDNTRMPTPGSTDDRNELNIANLNSNELNQLRYLLQNGYESRKNNVYKYYGIGADLRRNKRIYDSSNFDVPDFFDSDASALNFFSEAIPILTLAEMVILYTHSQLRLQAPSRSITIVNKLENSLHDLKIKIKNRERNESSKISLESCVSFALHSNQREEME